jgi:uncharacterized integral membrane protein
VQPHNDRKAARDGGSAEQRHGVRTNPRQIAGIVLVIALVWFILANRKPVDISFFVVEVSMPLWLVLGGTASVGAAVGFLLGGRRQKRKLRGG